MFCNKQHSGVIVSMSCTLKSVFGETDSGAASKLVYSF